MKGDGIKSGRLSLEITVQSFEEAVVPAAAPKTVDKKAAKSNFKKAGLAAFAGNVLEKTVEEFAAEAVSMAAVFAVKEFLGNEDEDVEED